ncbi:hypothetical protein Tco_1123318 [Tanacetum coccineum]|uniref:Reverse transcriptase domain-containing protein n=1 Tax=Tanacetum coccineum TaxID=301880 RepID=A0ABQ5J5Y5_9ASTR
MPFRLTNAPASKEDHEVHLKMVLELLKKEKLLCTHAKRQGRERDSRNAAWPGPTNGKKGMWRSWWNIYFAALVDIAEGIENTAKTCVLLIILKQTDKAELVQETTDKVVLIKEKLKAVRDCQKSYVGNMRKTFRVEVGDKVMLEVSSWKDVVHFGKKEMLAPKVFSGYLHVHFKEIKVDKTLHFVEEPVEIINRKVKSLKRSRVPIVKSIGNSKRGHEDFIETKYPHLLVEQAITGSTK